MSEDVSMMKCHANTQGSDVRVLERGLGDGVMRRRVTVSERRWSKAWLLSIGVGANHDVAIQYRDRRKAIIRARPRCKGAKWDDHVYLDRLH